MNKENKTYFLELFWREQRLRKWTECDLQKPGERVYVRREENWHEDPGTNPGLVYSTRRQYGRSRISRRKNKDQTEAQATCGLIIRQWWGLGFTECWGLASCIGTTDFCVEGWLANKDLHARLVSSCCPGSGREWRCLD